VLTALFTGLVAPLNSTMIVVALPEMLADLGASLTWGSWIVLSYLVAMAAVQPLGGSLGDRFGQRRLVLLGSSGFLLASLVAAFAGSVEVLVVARTVQAITGAVAIPNGTALVRTLTPIDGQGRAFGLIGSGMSLAAALGPPLGGFVTESFGWRWIFAANVPVVAIGLILAAALPERAARAAARRFDLLGAALLLLMLVSATLAATSWRAPNLPRAAAPAAAVVALVTAAVLPRHVRRTPNPVLHLSLLRRPGFLPAGLTVLTSNLTMYTVLLAVPVYLARIAGWNAHGIGLLLVGMSGMMALLGPIGGAASDRFGRRLPAVLGCVLTLVGVLPLAFLAPSWSWAALLVPLMVMGVGIGASSAPTHASAMQAASSDQAGRAAGLYSTMRYAGSITGSAVMAAVLGDAPGVPAFQTLFACLGGAAAVAVLTAAMLPGRPR